MMTTRLPIAARRHPVVTALAHGLEVICGDLQVGPIVIAASGGVDSTAMLLATQVLTERREIDLKPTVVHVNHHLRADAGVDADHVRTLCEQLGLAFECIDVHPERGGEDARRCRYDALHEAAVRHDARWVLVAHHAEDQLETIVAALGRGAGPEGLSGMASVRALFDDVRLVRPLLQVTKDMLRDLCDVAEVAWRDDPTNADPSTLRGRLRRDVLPVLEELWPNAARRSAMNAPLLHAAATALEREAETTFGSGTRWPRAELRSVDAAIRSTGLRRALLSCGLCSDAIDTTRLVEAAEAVGDRSDHARRFEFNATTAILIDANTVSITQETSDA